MSALSVYPSFSPGAFMDASVHVLKEADGCKEIIKVPLAVMDWKSALGGELSPGDRRVYSGLRDTKNLVGGLIDLGDAACRLKDHVVYMANGADSHGNPFGVVDFAREAFFDGVDFVNPVGDLIAVGESWGAIELSPETTSALEGACSAALILGCGKGAVTSAQEIMKSSVDIEGTDLSEDEKVFEKAKLIKSCFDLAKMISYVALGVILGIAWFGVAMPLWIPLAASTAALVASLGGYFHKHLSLPGAF